MSALNIRNVRKVFGKTTVLDDIHLQASAGEFIILVGASGCGKSTLLNMIAGLDVPTSGSIHIGDRDVTHLPSKDRDIAMVFQSYALYPTMTVAGNIAFGLEMRKVPRPERDKAIARVAKMLQIEHLLDRKPAQLSGGQRQRVAMGRALARDPKLFLFDEPLSNLDAKLRVEMRAEIKALHQRLKTTSIYVTHDQVEAMTMADRIVVLNGGEIEQIGTPLELYHQPKTRFVAGFLGAPAMNFLPVVVQGDSVQLPGGGTLVMQAELKPSRQGAAELGVRPERLRVVGPDAPSQLRCEVTVVEPLGADTLVMMRCEGHKLVVRGPGDSPLRPGDTAQLALDADAVTLFDPQTGQR